MSADTRFLRYQRPDRFTRVDNELFADPAAHGLRWNDLGLLVYLLSRPADWKVRVGQLAKVTLDGEHAVRQSLKRLEEAGFMHSYGVRDERGQTAGWVREYADHPRWAPLRDNPHVGSAQVENRGVLSTESTNDGSNQLPAPPQAESEDQPEASSKAAKRRRSTYPDSLSLSDSMREAAGRAGLAAGWHDHEFAQFGDFHRSKGSLMADWEAAWRTWARKASTFTRSGPSPSGRGSATPARGYTIPTPILTDEDIARIESGRVVGS